MKPLMNLRKAKEHFPASTTIGEVSTVEIHGDGIAELVAIAGLLLVSQDCRKQDFPSQSDDLLE